MKHVKRPGAGKVGRVIDEKLAAGRKPISSRRLPLTATSRPPPSSLPTPVTFGLVLRRECALRTTAWVGMNRVVREKTLGEVLLSGADLGDAAAYGAHQAASF